MSSSVDSSMAMESSSSPPQSRRSSLSSTCSIGTCSVTTQRVPPRLSPPCSKRLRSGLLNKLGIVDQRTSAAVAATSVRRGSILGDIKIVKAPLKEVLPPVSVDKGRTSVILDTLGSFFKAGSSPSSLSDATAMTDDLSSTCSSLADMSPQRPRRSLTFDEQVSVVHIPRREQYSRRIQEHLWHSPELLQHNVARNTIEYAADGWKWQDVREEDQHSICPQSGELIHPVHSEIARLIRQEQGLPADAPVWTPFWKHTPIAGGVQPATTLSLPVVAAANDDKGPTSMDH